MYEDPDKYKEILSGPNLFREATSPPGQAEGVASECAGVRRFPYVPLLTEEQEKALFMRLNLLKLQQHKLQQTHKDTVPPEAVLHHFMALATAVEADRTMIFLANTGLIESVAIGYIRRPFQGSKLQA